MKNWKYIEGAKTGNGVFSIFKSDKPIKMKSPQGAIVTINPDGTAAHQDKEGSQMAVHPHNSFKEAVEYYKSQGYVKVSNESLGEYMAKKPRVINEEKTGAEEFFKQLSDDVKEREKKDDADIEKVGNREVYVNQYERTKAVVYEDGTIMLWDKNGNNYKTIKAGSLEEARKKLNSDYKKVGNARYTTREDVISHLDTDLYDICKKMPSGTTPWAYLLELQKKGWDMNTISKYSKEIGKIVDRYKAGNKTGNVFTSSDKKRLDELARKKPTQLTPQEWKEFQDLNKREEEASREMLKKSGNSASDDKFAYVMREFDEGKLKTPDGKVVTDPAQAKAIAYSESKKTENGLARARNAMNPIKYKGYTIRFRPNSQKYYISSGPGDTYVREYAYKEYASEQDAKDAIDHLK